MLKTFVSVKYYIIYFCILRVNKNLINNTTHFQQDVLTMRVSAVPNLFTQIHTYMPQLEKHTWRWRSRKVYYFEWYARKCSKGRNRFIRVFFCHLWGMYLVQDIVLKNPLIVCYRGLQEKLLRLHEINTIILLTLSHISPTCHCFHKLAQHISPNLSSS